MWRYSRIDQLELDRFHPVEGARSTAGEGRGPSPSDRVRWLVDQLGPRAGLVVTFNGVLATVSCEVDDDVCILGRVGEHTEGERLLGRVAADPSDFVLLNDAFAVDPLVVDFAEGTPAGPPVVVVHLVSGDGLAVFPRTMIRAQAGSVASVVELVVDPDAGLLDDGAGATAQHRQPSASSEPTALVVPVVELEVDEGAVLSYVSIQSLGSSQWELAHQSSTIGADASLRSFTVALGGSYARMRTDSALTGESGASELRAAFFGRGDQMHDFRTLQDHRAPKTTSDLLFKGAVADRAHSVYSGLIRVHRGAVKADAMQTNHNLVLDEGAHADSVPNLDIEENDVRCSHGSTVGPVDEDQRYYLESRGVEPSVAELLIVGGFFEDIADQVPVPGARALVGRALAERVGGERG